MAGRSLGRQSPKKRPTDFQPRDLVILQMLKKAKVLTTGDFVPFVFNTFPVARRRLLKLVGERYIAAYAPALHEETRYMLDRRGMIALQEEGKFDGELRSAPKNPPTASDHHLMLVRLWSRIIAECRDVPELVLHRFSFEWEEAAGHLSTITRFRPDAVLVVEDDEDEHVYLIEVDTGTESPGVVRAKFETFARMQAASMEVYGEVPTGMLILTPSHRRLIGLARGGLGSERVFGRVFDHREEGAVLSAGWCRLRDLVDGRPAVTGAVVRRR